MGTKVYYERTGRLPDAAAGAGGADSTSVAGGDEAAAAVVTAAESGVDYSKGFEI